MSGAVAMSVDAASGRVERGAKSHGWFRRPVSVAIAILLALSPVGAILVLGWIVRLMQREAAIAVARQVTGGRRTEAIGALARQADLAALARWTGWVQPSTLRQSWLGRTLGGLIETVRAGIAAALALALATLPYAALLLLSWWAGWENSFNKGYEQAWVGPLVAFIGIAIALSVLSHLPMAFAHFAAERRLSAMFELRTIRMLIREQRWRNVWLALLAVLAALPIAAAQIVPVFIEGVWPGFASMPPEIIEQTANRWHFAATVYLILVLIFLRRAQARCYARSALALPAERAPFVHSVRERITGDSEDRPTPARKRGWAGAVLPTALLAVIWFALIAQLYVAQFANHGWWNWANHPLIALPWVYRPL